MTELERMARAMMTAMDDVHPAQQPYIDDTYIDDAILDGRFDVLKMARAALLAIREPDIGGVFDADPDAPYWYANAASQDFTAMIDAILNETPE